MTGRSAPLLAILALTWLLALAVASCWPQWDGLILAPFHAGARPAMAALAVFVTDLGGWRVLFALALAGALVLALRGRRRDALLLLAIVASGRAMVELQKLLIGRARPDGDHLVIEQSFSFPSGHSASAMVTYLAVALLLFRGRAAVIAALALAFAVGCTRMMLGVHWPSDVVGGWAFGAFWVLALIALAKRYGFST